VSDNPFGPLFGDLFSVLGRQGPDAWFETAKSLALNVARGADDDPNPDVTARQRVEQFAPLVARHVGSILGVGTSDTVSVVHRSALAIAALEQWRPLVQPMVDAPALSADDLPAIDGDDGAGALGQIAATIGPLFTGFQLGSVAGHFVERAWSLAALPLPRASTDRLIVANNVAHFADEWSLSADGATVFALAREFAASVVLAQPGTADALRALLLEAVADAVAAQGDIVQRLARLVGTEQLGSLLGDPDALLDELAAPAPTDATRAIDAAAAALHGAFDAIAFSVAEQVLGPIGQLREAYDRYRFADARGEDAAAAIFGISNRGDHRTAADGFVRAVVDARGLSAFTALLRADGLPTDSELHQPERWLERVEHSPLA
jgi:uncharacterized protein (DUF2342 family)